MDTFRELRDAPVFFPLTPRVLHPYTHLSERE